LLAGITAGAALQGCRSTAPKSAAPKAYPRGPVDSRGIPEIRPVTLEERAAYAGSQECVTCHRDLAGQLDSHHARTAAAVGEQDTPRFQAPSEVEDGRYGVRYRTAVQDGKHVLLVSQKGSQGTREAAGTAEWSFGSGSRGVTYLGTWENQPVELRLSYFSRQKRWGYTPGQQVGLTPETPVGRVLDPPSRQSCFDCHTTALVREQDELKPEASILGVGCETCHGPGRAHIEAVQRGEADLRMADLSKQRAEVVRQVCSHCHRDPEAGEPENPFVAAQLPRTQGLALSLSACFKKSGGKLTCITCHNPHRNAEPVSTRDYGKICLSCHSPEPAKRQVSCKVQPTGDCVKCHMPLQEVLIPTRPKFNTHWIKVWKPGEGPAAVSGLIQDLGLDRR
jgi:predicted CXXCH cytochrome family protein